MKNVMYRAIFRPSDKDLIPQLDEFLKDNLQEPRKHRPGHNYSSIIIEVNSEDFEGEELLEDCETVEDTMLNMKDELFRTAEWFKHNNPVGKMDYTVYGFVNEELAYLSICERCREGEDHRDHS